MLKTKRYELIYNKGYQTTDAVSSAVTTKVKGDYTLAHYTLSTSKRIQ
jgi:hypothetical protein